MRSLIDILELSTAELDKLLATADDIIENPEKYAHKCDGKKLATLFFEPSTRTRLSFEAAMYELGGNVLGFSEAQSSSAAKGESVADTAKTVSCYADIIAMRHPKEGAPLVASMHAGIPVINAGDGGHCHPTQTLADLLWDALQDNLISLEDLYTTESRVISTITASVRYRERWEKFCSLSAVLCSDQPDKNEGWRIIPSKKRYIDPFVLHSGRVSSKDADFTLQVCQFLEQSLDHWVRGI